MTGGECKMSVASLLLRLTVPKTGINIRIPTMTEESDAVVKTEFIRHVIQRF